MKLYQLSDVNLTYQNFGSTWLGILRGTEKSIMEVFNGLYNLRATNGECQFFDHLQTVGLFWTDKRSMIRFFFNQFYLSCNDRTYKYARYCLRAAHVKMAEMTTDGNHEEFLNFANKFDSDTYRVGQTRAERPDADFKDAVLAHAFKDKSN